MELRFREALLCDTFDGESVSFSPDCRFLAVLASNATISIKDVVTLEDAYTIECPGPINSFQWSPDSKLMLVSMKNLNALQIYFVEKARINKNHLTPSFAGISGGKIDTERTIWAPDSTFVLIFGALSSQLFAWNITNRVIHKLTPPKNSATALEYSPDGSVIAELARESGKDVLILMDSQTFKRKTTINLSTLDATTVKWSPDGTSILVIDAISRHLLEIINVKTQKVCSHSAYDGYLGITAASACQNSKILAIGGFDDYVRLLVAPEWKLLAEFLHETSIKSQSVVVYKENGDVFEQSESPVDLMQAGESGMTYVEWAVGSRLLATVSARTPSTVFIWNVETVSLIALVVFNSAVVKIEWSPTEEVLAMSTGAGFIATWSPVRITKTPTYDALQVQSFEWRSDGEEILACNRTGTFAVACRT